MLGRITNMDIQEILDGLNDLISDNCTDTQFDYIDEIKAAIQIIEKQVPKDVIVQGADSQSYGIIKFYYCPDCHKLIERPFDEQSYCRHCGRLINRKP